MKTLIFLLSFAALSVLGRSPEREFVSFSITTNAGFGTNVYVVGSHPDVGSWAPTSAVKLRYTSGNVWTGQIAVQKGTALEYKFIVRSGASNRYCDATNVIWEPGPNRTNILPSAPAAPYSGKTMFYYSGWTNVDLISSTDHSNFTAKAMQLAGAGRTSNEWLYTLRGFGEEGEGVEFIPSGSLNGGPFYDHAPYGGYGTSNYFTTLDVFLLQVGNVFNYWPSNNPSPPRVVTNFVNSSVPAITGRTVKIYLPRGYDDHLWKRYPVVYMQDGTNFFDPGSANGTWSADATATREISQGRLRECIIAAVDNIASYRRTEYEPPGDTYPGEVPGVANEFLRFLADNVRPMLDFNFRTLNDRRNTLVGGSSMGGIFSIYAGFETNVFGGVLAMSPAVTRAPNYAATLPGKSKQPMRIYIDTGTDENQVGTLPGGYYWDDPWRANDSFMKVGYVPNEDLMMRIGCGDQHNEAAWRSRLPQALRFLLNIRDEPNVLAQQVSPPTISGMSASGATLFPSQQLFSYQLQFAGDASGTWSNAGPFVAESRPWNTQMLTNPVSSDTSAFWRVVSTPAP